MSLTLTLVRGLPGSGKSTLARKICSETGASHYEADMYFVKNGVYSFNPKLIGNAHSYCQNKTRDDLKKGLSVVVSNTFVKLWEMTKYVDMAHEFGAELVIIEAKGNYQNIHGVPDSKIEDMRNRWEEIK